MNTYGFHGPLTRYTTEEGRRFLEEEAKRSAEETAAYYAWKRGEAPLGAAPTYIPPSPSASPSPSSSASATSSPPSSSSSSSSPSYYSTDFQPTPGEPSAFERPISTAVDEEHRAPIKQLFDEGKTPFPRPTKHLFDDPVFNSPADSSKTNTPPENEDTFEEDGDLKDAEKVDIDSLDLDDQSPEGREKRMRAMADELYGFSSGQRREAMDREERKIKEWRTQGREVMDKFGTRFEEMPPTDSRKRR